MNPNQIMVCLVVMMMMMRTKQQSQHVCSLSRASLSQHTTGFSSYILAVYRLQVKCDSSAGGGASVEDTKEVRGNCELSKPTSKSICP